MAVADVTGDGRKDVVYAGGRWGEQQFDLFSTRVRLVVSRGRR